ncbi:hypothetical protein BHE74_00004374 [Ensete ventricosum]|nr:hypothetical protein GW17_00054935 [Ensete ventricosum]RWW86837.1 hypothetical protein BHE74_00004374 [Ensete ventricosum]RZR78229.1 hypothetical protein BHM03_00003508 [Ensete ventricosum]
MESGENMARSAVSHPWLSTSSALTCAVTKRDGDPVPWRPQHAGMATPVGASQAVDSVPQGRHMPCSGQAP